MRILLDTNVLLRSIEPDHAHYLASVDAIGLLCQQGHELVIVPQVLYEFWSVATRPVENMGLGMSPLEAHSELSVIQRLFRLLRDERAVFPLWLQLVVTFEVKGKKSHDARLAAAMQRHAVTHLLTFNTSDFVRYPHLTAQSPISVLANSGMI